MNPPVTQTLAASSALVAIVGAKVFFGLAPQGTEAPYVSWGYVSANPNNNLSDRPDGDDVRIQVDCYSPNQAQCKALAVAARDALEAVTHIVSGPLYVGMEDDTKLHRWTMDLYFLLQR